MNMNEVSDRSNVEVLPASSPALSCLLYAAECGTAMFPSARSLTCYSVPERRIGTRPPLLKTQGRKPWLTSQIKWSHAISS